MKGRGLDAAGSLITAVFDKSSAQTGAGALPKRTPIAATAIRGFEKQSGVKNYSYHKLCAFPKVSDFLKKT
jgi:hypothetical protein